MVTIKILDGKYVGQTQQIDINKVCPMELLQSCFEHQWHWEIDYSHANTKKKAWLF